MPKTKGRFTGEGYQSVRCSKPTILNESHCSVRGTAAVSARWVQPAGQARDVAGGICGQSRNVLQNQRLGRRDSLIISMIVTNDNSMITLCPLFTTAPGSRNQGHRLLDRVAPPVRADKSAFLPAGGEGVSDALHRGEGVWFKRWPLCIQ